MERLIVNDVHKNTKRIMPKRLALIATSLATLFFGVPCLIPIILSLQHGHGIPAVLAGLSGFLLLSLSFLLHCFRHTASMTRPHLAADILGMGLVVASLLPFAGIGVFIWFCIPLFVCILCRLRILYSLQTK
jgi:hypothetical protein